MHCVPAKLKHILGTKRVGRGTGRRRRLVEVDEDVIVVRILEMNEMKWL